MLSSAFSVLDLHFNQVLTWWLVYFL